MHTILITGFGRFPGSPVNPSGVVAARLAKQRRPALAGTRRVAHVFATRYDAVERELPALLEREKPDIVVMFGVATRSRMVRIEERARNRIALFPDAGRRRPAAQTIALNRDAQRNPLPLARLVTAARSAGVAATRSRNAGSYLCNYVYWRGLEAAARPDGPDTVIFVHVPPVAVKHTPKRRLKEKLRRRPPGKRTKPAQRRRRAPGIDDLVRAGEAIVVAMIPLATQTPVQADSDPTMIPLATQTPVQADSGPTMIPLATQTPVQADSGPTMIPLATQPPVQADSGPSNRFTRGQPSRWSALARRMLAAGRQLRAAWRRD
jgi:pyroglutamyl-peptidase